MEADTFRFLEQLLLFPDLEPDKEQRQGRPPIIDEFLRDCIEFRSSQTFLDAMKFVGRFTYFAPFNALLIYLQRPTASFVASRSQWRRKLKREVLPDALPIVILVPMGPVSFVYDYADTKGRPIPDYYGEPFKVTGEFEKELWDNTLAAAGSKGFEVVYKKKSYLNAACVSRWANDQFIIEISEDYPQLKYQYTFLVHELAHILCGHLGPDPKKRRWPDRKHLSKNQREIEAETVAHIVASRKGLETRSMEYVAGYIENDKRDLQEVSATVILRVAEQIEGMGGFIEGKNVSVMKEKTPSQKKTSTPLKSIREKLVSSAESAMLSNRVPVKECKRGR